MSLIHGPKTVPSTSLLGGEISAAIDQAKSAVGTTLIREMENMIGIRFDPAPAYLFYVSVSGLMVALFTACEGVSVSRSVEEVHEGGLNDQVHTLPGGMKAGRVTLKRGLSVSRELWDWFSEGIFDCKVKRQHMSIIQGAPGMSALSVVGVKGPGIIKNWDLEGAFPTGYSLSSLDVNDTDHVAIESVEIACRTITLSKIVGTPMSPSALIP
jgi:phage tail-like protein